MTKISREEVIKIARISAISLKEEEIDTLIGRMEAVLSYTERVKEIAQTIEEPSNKNVNIFRQDLVIPQNPEPILAQAPDRADNYFVVPMILDN